jgi:hypothetical protein
MEIVLIVIVALTLVLPRYFMKKLSDKTRFIISFIAGLLLLGLVWLFGSEGQLIYKLVITLVVIVSAFTQIRKLYFLKASE